MEYGEYTLYADPREDGAIEIFVYKKDTAEGIIKKKMDRNNTNIPIGVLKCRIAGKTI